MAAPRNPRLTPLLLGERCLPQITKCVDGLRNPTFTDVVLAEIIAILDLPSR